MSRKASALPHWMHRGARVNFAPAGSFTKYEGCIVGSVFRDDEDRWRAKLAGIIAGVDVLAHIEDLTPHVAVSQSAVVIEPLPGDLERLDALTRRGNAAGAKSTRERVARVALSIGLGSLEDMPHVIDDAPGASK